jgi:heat-inducible transcriptional repressor
VPVGSKTIAAGGFGLSPASIRGVMSDLEGLGLLTHPHTSAGRVPTETGLRLFVDAMMRTAEPTIEERALIEGSARGPVEDALAAASTTLSGLSACAGIVMVPGRELRLRQIHFVPLSPLQTLAVLVGIDGEVDNRVVDLPAPVPRSALTEAGNYMTARFGGLTLGEATLRMAEEVRTGRAALDSAAQSLIARGLADWSRDGAQRPVLIVRGAANLIDDSAARDLERVRQLLDEIEGAEEIARLLEGAREGAATKVFIGAENKLFALSGSSVIAAPYRGREGRVVGVVGVIGPTRLNYARVVPMVDLTAQALSQTFQRQAG